MAPPMDLPPHPATYYAASAGAPREGAVLTGDRRCDVCVIGGGFTGISTALDLAERGYKVIVLEAERIGWGASGRNGGQMVAGYAASVSGIRGLVGDDDAAKLWAMGLEAIDLVGERVAGHAIDCELKWGYLFAAQTARQLRELSAMQNLWETRYDYPPMRLLGRRDVRDAVDSPRYVGGLIDPRSGHLHPLKLAFGIARAAQEAGAELFEDSRVLRLDHTEPVIARTANGSVTARYAVLAGNAYLGDLVPRLRRTLMPVGSNIAATVSLGEKRAEGLIRDDLAVADASFIVTYFCRSADHRLLFGGRASYSLLDPPNLAAFMRGKMLRVFPQLADATFEYVWGGQIGITMNRIPHFGRLGAGNVYFCQGFSGHGVALSHLAGKLMAEAIAGNAERFDVFSRIPHRTFPGGRLRTPALVLAMLYYRLRDML